MSTLVTIQSTDLITNSRADLNGNFSALNTDKMETSVLDVDSTLAANSDAKIPSQKAVKAYVDAGGQANASTTVKGIVELATQAELEAGTATGATGAALVVTPDIIGSSLGSSKKAMVAGATINGATLPVPVYQNKTDNQFYACDANDTSAMKFVGFAITNGVDNGSITVQFSGIVAGFTGLLEGEKYYIQDAVGTIGTTIGTYEILVGVAISETELLIQKGTRRASGLTGSLGTASGSSSVTCGFRPAIIRLKGMSVDSTVYNTMEAVWVNGVLTGIGSGNNDGVSGSARLYDNSISSNSYMEFTITSVSDTGFTITWTETNTYNVLGSNVIWEAEGEL